MRSASYIRTYVCQNRQHFLFNYTSRGTSSEALKRCPKCASVHHYDGTTQFFCKGCQWPVDSSYLRSIDPFDMFSLPKVYNIDKVLLSQRYKLSQFSLHPDKHASKPEDELQLITSNSTVVNDLYRTILDDKARAKLLFCIKYGEEKFNEELERTDSEVLDEIMEVHERIHTLENSEQAEEMCKEIEQVLQFAVENLATAFESDDISAIMRHFKTLSFYRQMLEKVQNFKGPGIDNL